MIDINPEVFTKLVVFTGGLILFIRLFARKLPKDAAEGEDLAPLPEDRKVAGYLVGKMVADGGTATVYEAVDGAGNLLAIKIPHESSLSDKTFVQTFQREAEIGTTLQHPSIVRVHEAGSYQAGRYKRIPYFVMELLEGQDLRTIIREHGPREPMEAAQIARGIADALQWAHHRGVIHRDISPRNIFITSRRGVKVMDFGISSVFSRTDKRKAGKGLSLGTPEYLAPERTNDTRGSDPRSDLYSLGCVFYEMLAGYPPFTGEDARQILMMHRKAKVPPLPAPIDARIEKIVLKLLEKNPDNRYHDAAQVTADLADLQPVV